VADRGRWFWAHSTVNMLNFAKNKWMKVLLLDISIVQLNDDTGIH
jgi:hypothetical protein